MVGHSMLHVLHAHVLIAAHARVIYCSRLLICHRWNLSSSGGRGQNAPHGVTMAHFGTYSYKSYL